MRPDVIKSTCWGFASGFIRNDKTNLRILYFAADWSFFVHGKCNRPRAQIFDFLLTSAEMQVAQPIFTHGHSA